MLKHHLLASATLALCCACHAGGSKTPNVEDTDERMDESSAESEAIESDDAETAGPAVRVRHAQQDPAIHSPTDATPSPDGEAIYYVANADGDEGRLPGVFSVPADGGELTALVMGEPLSAPMGIAVSLDGRTLFVADMTATGDGAIVRGGSDGESFAPIDATSGLLPRAVSVGRVDSEEWVVFTGRDPESAEAAVYRLDGDTVEAIAVGAPLVSPAGVTVDRDGTVYVIDALADDGAAALLELDGDDVSIVRGGLGVGFPAGITLTLDESTALISGLAPETGRDVVYLVNLESRELGTITDPVEAFAEPAGLHRAHDQNVFAWADSEANDTGTVYVLAL